MSQGGIAGLVITPDSVGYTTTIEYHSTSSMTADFWVFRDDTLLASTTLERREGVSQAEGELRYVKPVLGMDTQTYRLVGADSLILNDACCDGFTYTFRRLP